jgi:hypothetical protein
MARTDTGPAAQDSGPGTEDAGPMGQEDAATGPNDGGMAELDARAPDDGGRSQDTGTPEDASRGTDAPSWSEEVYPILAGNCEPCHTNRASGALDMSSASSAHSNLVEVDAAGPACGSGSRVRVVPGDASSSLLYQKVSGTQDCGSQMPLVGGPLSESQIQTLGAWIDAGAMND